MPEIIISINRPYTDRILQREKTIELRKSVPRYLPCRVYIYETKNHGGCGMIIGEFILYSAEIYQKRTPEGTVISKPINFDVLWSQICITGEEYEKYSVMHNNKYPNIYAWQIEKFLLFKIAKPLSEFGISRPPQSWCYIKNHR